MGAEAKDIIAQAECYRYLKCPADKNVENYERNVIRDVSQEMLYQVMPDDEAREGKFNKKNYPIVNETIRLNAYRKAVLKAHESGIMLDSFEKKLMNIQQAMDRRIELFHKTHYGKNMQSGMQGTADTSGIDDQTWRGDIHTEKEPVFEALHDWHTPDDEMQDVRESSLEEKFSSYIEAVMHTTNAANRLWMAAQIQIDNGQKVELNNKEINAMKKHLKTIGTAHDAFLAALEENGVQYEFRDLIHHMRNPNHVENHVQKLISIASRPEQLEREIRKGLPNTKGIS